MHLYPPALDLPYQSVLSPTYCQVSKNTTPSPSLASVSCQTKRNECHSGNYESFTPGHAVRSPLYRISLLSAGYKGKTNVVSFNSQQQG